MFIKNLSVDALYGVGKVTAEKLHQLNIKTCTDLQQLSLAELTIKFGKLGQHLYNQCRGIDHRRVEPNRVRKSLSVERTFPEDIDNLATCLENLRGLYDRLVARTQELAPKRPIKNQYIKIKFFDFTMITAEIISHSISLDRYLTLFRESYARVNKPVRLLGVGVNFSNDESEQQFLQQSLFEPE